MAKSFFFYDLETTGVNSRRSRIMQFAGQRTDEDLKPIGEPYDIMVRLSEDILPDPEAILLTGITPQKTLEEGISEAEFCKLFTEEIARPDTCFVGYNNVRFDDEFMRFMLYRNFYDPYTWQWKDGRSRWDLLDVVRMTRALRPDDIKWPFDDKGVCTNRLELLTKENNLLHEAAHDALSDVKATIAVASMINSHQPKLFSYLYSIRNKREVMSIVSKGQPFVYTSGRYQSEFDKTTIVHSLGPHPSKQGVLVYDLRVDPTEFLKMDIKGLAEAWQYKKDREEIRLPIKAMQFNRVPAIAPLAVLDSESKIRLQIDLDTIKKHKALLDEDASFYDRVRDTVDYMNKSRGNESILFSELQSPDEQLYDGFIGDIDRKIADRLVSSSPASISEVAEKFKDERLKKLTPLYKARNFPKYLSDEERRIWEDHKKHVLLSGGSNSRYAKYVKRLSELSQNETDSNRQYLLEELRLYAESIVPEI